MTGVRAIYRRVDTVLRFEPSWFAECMAGVAMLLWSVSAFITDDHRMNALGYVAPLAGLLLGPARMAFLFRLNPEPRVLAACASFVWFAGLFAALCHTRGTVPGLGLIAAFMLGDLLTVAKFSLIAHWERQADTHDGD